MRYITFSLTLFSLTLFEVANAFAATAKCDIRYRIFVNAFGGLARPPVRCGVCENHPVRCGLLTNTVTYVVRPKKRMVGALQSVVQFVKTTQSVVEFWQITWYMLCDLKNEWFRPLENPD